MIKKKLLENKLAMATIVFITFVALLGIFAPYVAPNDPYETDIINKFAPFSKCF